MWSECRDGSTDRWHGSRCGNALTGSTNPYSFLLSTAMKYLPFEQTPFTSMISNVGSMYGAGNTLAGLAGYAADALGGGLASAATGTPGMAGFGMAEGAGAAGVIGETGALSSALTGLSQILGPLGAVAALGSMWYGHQASRRREHHAMDDYQNKLNPAVRQAFGQWTGDPETAIKAMYEGPGQNAVLSDQQVQYMSAAYMNSLAQKIAASKYTDQQKQTLMGLMAKKFSNSLAQAKAAGGTMADYNKAGLKWTTLPIAAQRQANLEAISKLPDPYGRTLGDWGTVDAAKYALQGPAQWFSKDQLAKLGEIQDWEKGLPQHQ